MGWYVGGSNVLECSCCNEPAAPTFPCSSCSSDATQVYRIAITGIANNNCAVCGNYNGTFDVTNIGSCAWRADLPNPACPNTPMAIELNLNAAGPDSSIRINIGDLSGLIGAHTVQFEQFVAGQLNGFDCGNFNNQPVNFRVIETGSIGECDVTNAQCLITAL